MGLKPSYPVQSNQIIELNRGNPAKWEFSLHSGSFGSITSTHITFKNTYGQTIDTWNGSLVSGSLVFTADAAHCDLIPLATSWTLKVDTGGGDRLYAQGMVVRNEAPFPNAPALNINVQAIQYNYKFGSVGVVTDLVWIILSGNPEVYDNSGISKPNAVAAGNLSGTFDSVAMLYYAPLNTDSVRATYTIVPGAAGEAWITFSSKYDATNFVAFRHLDAGTDKVSIAVGSSSLTLVDKISLTHTLAYENFTAEYNPSTNTYSLYKGTDTTPLIFWEDTTDLIIHGAGDRYVGMGFKSTGAAAGPELCKWRIADAV